MAGFLLSAALGAKAIANALTPNPAAQNVFGAQNLDPSVTWNGVPNDPNYDPYGLVRRGWGAHDMTLNRPLVGIKRFPNPRIAPMRDYQRRVIVRKQVGPETVAFSQHMLADALPPDPPFYGDSKSVSYKRRLVAERMPCTHPGLTMVDRTLHHWNQFPMPMFYDHGHPRYRT